jgi:hypothetical protein
VTKLSCPVQGCSGQRRQGQLVCRRHWHDLPRDQRGAVWDAWDRYNAALRDSDADPSEKRLAASLYREVTEKAIAFLESRGRGKG